MPSLSYINEKLSDAIYILTIHEDDARTRLARVISKIVILPPESFPPELQEDFKWVLKMPDKGLSYRKNLKSKDWPSPSKLSSIRNSTASKIIIKIVYIQNKVHEIIEYGDK